MKDTILKIVQSIGFFRTISISNKPDFYTFNKFSDRLNKPIIHQPIVCGGCHRKYDTKDNHYFKRGVKLVISTLDNGQMYSGHFRMVTEKYDLVFGKCPICGSNNKLLGGFGSGVIESKNI